MLGRHGPRVIALAMGVVATATLAFLPDELEASGSCLPKELKSRLAQVRSKFGSVEIVSTYRGGARMPNGRSSYHANCRAVDFNPPRGKYSQVASWLKSNHGGGVGTYSCGMHHIHLDNGPRVRFHHCQSAEAGPEMDAEAIRAARAEWPKAGTAGVWPLILPDVLKGTAARL
ncbi:MAG: D-Ala-D-Ala carboxypeptidase family metallohydrolase [Hyphomicrobiaceae bacterium]|nr:D-Ala-D-Ala carboxypeptidase family metallohydrolase [Hyphomicrobiaceae bacterium]